jgi:protein FRG1
VKKKKRSHKEIDGGDDVDSLIEAGDPTGKTDPILRVSKAISFICAIPDWIYPKDVLDILGPSFILLPTTPPTCLAWNPTLQRVYAAPVTLPVAPADESELTINEALEVVEPTDVNQVWVVARLSGSEDVITLRSSTWVVSSA